MEELPQGEALPDASSAGPVDERRGFVAHIAAVFIGAFVFVFPLAAGLGTLLDPLRRRKGAANDQAFIKVAPVAALPHDGSPLQCPIISDRDDAWSRLPREPIGAIYLRRLPGNKQIQAFNAVCPHLGCLVAFVGVSRKFVCPCHTSAFELDGKMIPPTPSPRDMDTLEWQIRDSEIGVAEVWVKFQNFHTGRESKLAKT